MEVFLRVSIVSCYWYCASRLVGTCEFRWFKVWVFECVVRVGWWLGLGDWI